MFNSSDVFALIHILTTRSTIYDVPVGMAPENWHASLMVLNDEGLINITPGGQLGTPDNVCDAVCNAISGMADTVLPPLVEGNDL